MPKKISTLEHEIADWQHYKKYGKWLDGKKPYKPFTHSVADEQIAKKEAQIEKIKVENEVIRQRLANAKAVTDDDVLDDVMEGGKAIGAARIAMSADSKARKAQAVKHAKVATLLIPGIGTVHDLEESYRAGARVVPLETGRALGTARRPAVGRVVQGAPPARYPAAPRQRSK
jgi:hypothetical protein